MTSLTIVGGGIGGLTAAIAAAEQGVGVTLYEATDRLGGRAWTTEGDFKANWGPHVIYGDGAWWPWLKERGLGEPAFRIPRLPKTAFRVDGRGRQFPPLGLLRSLAKVRRRSAPVDRSFQDWAADQVGDDHACALSSFMGVATFDHDPGRFSARFVQERLVRATAPIPTVRYIPAAGARSAGASDRTLAHSEFASSSVPPSTRSPTGPRSSPCRSNAPPSSSTTRASSRAGPAPRCSTSDSRARRRHCSPPTSTSQVGSRPTHCPTRRSRHPAITSSRHRRVCAPASPWTTGSAGSKPCSTRPTAGGEPRRSGRRRSRVEHSTGALDLPGLSWRNRPSVDRGGGVYLVGDMVAAPGLLAEVSFNSALAAVAGVTGSTDDLVSTASRRRGLDTAAGDVASAPAR